MKGVSDCDQPKGPEHSDSNKEFILILDRLSGNFILLVHSHCCHNVKSYLLSAKQQQTQLATYWWTQCNMVNIANTAASNFVAEGPDITLKSHYRDQKQS